MKPRNPGPAGRPAPATCPGLLRAIAGLLIWSVGFLALYVAHAQGCASMPSGMSGWLRTGLIVLWAAPLIALGAMLAGSGRRFRHARKPRGAGEPSSPAFMALLTLLLDASSLIAMSATGMPILFIPVCVGPMAA